MSFSPASDTAASPGERPDGPPAAPAGPARAPVRRCLVTGEERPKADLLRFVVGPGDRVVPDVDGRLPGRGLWTLARRDIVAAAVTRRLFSRAAKGPAAADPALPGQVEALLARRCVATLGLARRAGQAVGGFEKVRALTGRAACGALVVAAEASADGRRKLVRADGAPVVDVLTAAEIGGAFGRDDLTYAALARGDLARRLVVEAARLGGFRPAPEADKSVDGSLTADG